MTNEEAICAIDDIMIQLPEDSRAAEALFKTKVELSKNTKNPYFQCNKCGYWFMRKIEKEEYDKEFDITDYYCHCPSCGKEYQWNNCYWR